MSSELRLKLFIAGDSLRARQAAENLARAVGALADGAQVETVDVLEHPDVADEYRILTTPTVVREAPAPRRRVTGDLRDVAQVLAALALSPAPTQP
ncbi:MAG TPA: circadian clock KaiB family protein [Gemmatimonadaceae bacterium]|nr:circadian clock KaiB family protein [Gemmatimonadaceae bacterium]